MLSFVIGYNAWTGLPGTGYSQPAVHSFDSSWGGRVYRAASVLMAWVEQAEAEIFGEEFWSRLSFPPPGNLPDTGIESSLMGSGLFSSLIVWLLDSNQQCLLQPTAFPSLLLILVVNYITIWFWIQYMCDEVSIKFPYGNVFSSVYPMFFYAFRLSYMFLLLLVIPLPFSLLFSLQDLTNGFSFIYSFTSISDNIYLLCQANRNYVGEKLC